MANTLRFLISLRGLSIAYLITMLVPGIFIANDNHRPPFSITCPTGYVLFVFLTVIAFGFFTLFPHRRQRRKGKGIDEPAPASKVVLLTVLAWIIVFGLYRLSKVYTGEAWDISRLKAIITVSPVYQACILAIASIGEASEKEIESRRLKKIALLGVIIYILMAVLSASRFSAFAIIIGYGTIRMAKVENKTTSRLIIVLLVTGLTFLAVSVAKMFMIDVVTGSNNIMMTDRSGIDISKVMNGLLSRVGQHQIIGSICWSVKWNGPVGFSGFDTILRELPLISDWHTKIIHDMPTVLDGNKLGRNLLVLSQSDKITGIGPTYVGEALMRFGDNWLVGIALVGISYRIVERALTARSGWQSQVYYAMVTPTLAQGIENWYEFTIAKALSLLLIAAVVCRSIEIAEEKWGITYEQK